VRRRGLSRGGVPGEQKELLDGEKGCSQARVVLEEQKELLGRRKVVPWEENSPLGNMSPREE